MAQPRRLSLAVATADDMERLGAIMAASLLQRAAGESAGAPGLTMVPAGLCVTFTGDLGAGKTTMIRGLLKGLGHEGRVRSPTYTLVENYSLAGMSVYHLDLYRLAGGDELEYLGYRDLATSASLRLVEWPERAEGLLVPADLEVDIHYAETGRNVDLCANGGSGRIWLGRLAAGLASDDRFTAPQTNS